MFQPNFVTFTSTKISDHAFPLEGKFRGNQNDGFTFVLFEDGSGGVIKNLKDWTGNKTGRLYPAEILAAQEVLAARVGETMNAPIRECRFYGKDGLSVIMPYIEGENGEQAGQDAPPKGHQATALVLFDYLTANADRRPKNWLWTPDHRIVGIDHALCNFRPRTPTPELISLLWNNGVSYEALLILRPKLENLRLDFTQLGMGNKHETMMQNLSHLLQAFQILDQVAVVKGGPGSGRHPELHLVSEWSHQPGKIINYDTDGNQYIIEGNDWLFKGPFPAGDYVATFGATVKSRAGGMLAQALVRYRSQGTADQSIKSPVIHILHIESNQSARGAGFARKLVAALHDTVMPTGEAATIVHNSFTSDLGRNFANSLDPAYNQVKDEGEAAYRDPSNFQTVSKGGPGSGRHTEVSKYFPYGKEGSDEGAKISVDKVGKILHTREAIEVLNELLETPGYGNTPVSGGCLLTAQALKILFPHGEIKASVNTDASRLDRAAEMGRTPMIDHFALSIGGDRYLDGRGEVTEEHAANVMASMMGGSIGAYQNGLPFQHLVEATPKIIADAQTYMASPPGAAEKFADWILQQAGGEVKKGGPGSGRHKEVPANIAAFARNLKEFYDAGGTVERIDNDDKMLDVYHTALEMRETPEYKAMDARHQQGIRFLGEAALYARVDLRAASSEINPHQVVSSHLFVARNKDGEMMAAVNVAIHSPDIRLGDFSGPILPSARIGYLGSTGEMPGAATALMEQAIQMAADRGLTMTYETTADSHPYHEMLGVERLNDRGLEGFSAESAAKIAALPNPEPKIVKGGPGSGRHPELGKIVPAPVGNKYSVDKAVQQSMIEDTIAAVERSGEAKGKAIFRDEYTLADENNRGIVKENLVQAIADRLAGTDFDRILGLDADRSVIMDRRIGQKGEYARRSLSLNMALLSSYTFDLKDVAKLYERGVYSDEHLKSLGLQWDPTSKTITDGHDPFHRLASVKEPEVANAVRTQAVDDLVARWAKTSNDTDLTAHALQDAAEAEFGLHGTAPWTDPKPESVLDEDSMKGMRLFLRAQYEITQERLKAAGLDTLTLYRGMKIVPDGLEHGKSAEISTRPINAFSASKQVAFDFSKGIMTQSIAGPKGKGIVISGKVPAERVLSLATTGIGCLSEQEAVVLGGTDEWMVEKGDEIQRTIYHHSS